MTPPAAPPPAIPPAVALPAPAAAQASRPERLVSLDAYRGFVMLLMISAGFGITKVAASFPLSPASQFFAHQADHAAWRGCTLWDLIQPSFMFIVGVAVPYSLAARRSTGATFSRLFASALWRSFALIALGLFLASTGRPMTNFSFAIVLAQIGLGYPFLWLLGWTTPRVAASVAGLILLAYWSAFALHPITQPVGLPPDWTLLQGFEAHWQKNANFAASVDRWFLNLFPQEKPFEFNTGGYQTLNFVPSLATMIFGLLAGNLLKSERPSSEKLRWLAGTGVAALALGALWDISGFGPMVKRIWTPSFAIFSTGWALLLLTLFYYIIDVRRHRSWAFIFVVAGMNSIALYCMSMLLKPFIRERLKTHINRGVFDIFGPTYAPMVETTAILVVLWLAAYWMYRRKIFLRL